MIKTIFNPSYIRLIQTLKASRLATGMSQRDVANKLGVQRTWLTRIELCEVRLDVVQFIRVCQAIALPPARVLRQLERDLNGETPTNGAQSNQGRGD